MQPVGVVVVEMAIGWEAAELAGCRGAGITSAVTLPGRADPEGVPIDALPDPARHLHRVTFVPATPANAMDRWLSALDVLHAAAVQNA